MAHHFSGAVVFSLTAFGLAGGARAGVVVPLRGLDEVRLFTAPGVQSFQTSGGANGPIGTAVDASNNVYVTNSTDGSGSLVKYAPDLTSPTVVVPNSAGALKTPAGITFDTAGNTYVTNKGLFAGQTGAQQGGIALFNSSFALTATFALGSSRVPTGIAFSPVANPNFAGGYNLYVAESTTNTLNLYSTGNIAAASQSLAPAGALALNTPAGVAIDATRGIVYVANSGPTGTNANTIEAYNITTNTFSLFAAGGLLDRPEGLTVDPAGDVFVSNTGSGAILEYTAAGVPFASPYATGQVTPEFLAYTPFVPEPGLAATTTAAAWAAARRRGRRASHA